MSRIKIKNFGPIKVGCIENDGWIDIKKVTTFIGNQCSGKSSVAKLFSTLSWIEKALYKNEIDENEVKRKNRFQNYYCGYQNIKSYFLQNTEIDFEGGSYKFSYRQGKFDIQKKDTEILVPKIMYVPAERNFISVVSQPEKLKYLPKTLYTFLDEFERAKQEIQSSLQLPFNNLEFSYENGVSKVIGNNFEVILSEASSGLQSAIPLYIVSKNLADSINKVTDSSKNKTSLDEKKKLRERLEQLLVNENLTDELRNLAIELLSSITKNDCFINIVEEPEQNLFPVSQRSILNSLLEFNNMNKGNKLIITTHSPYIINYLSISIQGWFLKNKIGDDKKLLERLNSITPLKSLVSSSDVAIYQIEDSNGMINRLGDYEGIPSDKNYLNNLLLEGNQLFDSLLEIEEDL